MPGSKAVSDPELGAVLAAARLFSARDQVLIHTGLNTEWRRGPVHERSELPAIEPAPRQGGGKVVADGCIWQQSVAKRATLCYTGCLGGDLAQDRQTQLLHFFGKLV
jgi:hypothetical protein